MTFTPPSPIYPLIASSHSFCVPARAAHEVHRGLHNNRSNGLLMGYFGNKPLTEPPESPPPFHFIDALYSKEMFYDRPDDWHGTTPTTRVAQRERRCVCTYVYVCVYVYMCVCVSVVPESTWVPPSLLSCLV